MITEEIPDIQLIAQYPLELAQEAMILLRRLQSIKQQSQQVFPAQVNALEDVGSIYSVINSLQRVAFPDDPQAHDQGITELKGEE